MNAKTGKLIRKYAQACKFPLEGVRELWTETPRPKRPALRRLMQRKVG